MGPARPLPRPRGRARHHDAGGDLRLAARAAGDGERDRGHDATRADPAERRGRRAGGCPQAEAAEISELFSTPTRPPPRGRRRPSPDRAECRSADAAGDAVGMTTIIRATDANDLLALVPALAGFVPERSIVGVAFRGCRSAGVLRHDLPRRARDRPAPSRPSSEPSAGCPVSTPWCRSPTPTPRSPRLAACPSAVSSPCWCVAPPRRDSTSATRLSCRRRLGVAARPRRPASGHPLEAIDESSAARRLPAEALLVRIACRGRALPARDEATADALKRSSRRSPTSSGRRAVRTARPRLRPGRPHRGALVGEPAGCLLCGWLVPPPGHRPAIRDADAAARVRAEIGEAAHDDAAATASRAEAPGDRR